MARCEDCSVVGANLQSVSGSEKWPSKHVAQEIRLESKEWVLTLFAVSPFLAILSAPTTVQIRRI